ncbi:MAG: VCBS repeat-containing protein [Nitrospirae bacterium]|nr:VCBS repeat-containing protein [Nitrospirota bacterium]
MIVGIASASGSSGACVNGNVTDGAYSGTTSTSSVSFDMVKNSMSNRKIYMSNVSPCAGYTGITITVGGIDTVSGCSFGWNLSGNVGNSAITFKSYWSGKFSATDNTASGTYSYSAADGCIASGSWSATTPLVSTGDHWKYATQEYSGWTNTGYDDSAWQDGITPFNNQNSGCNTPDLYSGGTYWPLNSTYYLRKVVSLTQQEDLTFNVAIDNDITAYLDGVSIYSTTSEGCAQRWQYTFNALSVSQGQHVIAVKIVDRGGDTAFDMLVTGKSTSTPKIVNPANNHTYQRFDTTMTWADAKANCERLGGHLATVTSDSENKFLTDTSLFPSDSYGTCWLGATDTALNGTWVWVTVEQWQFTAWGTGEPNNYGGNEHCLTYYNAPGYTQQYSKWNDADCSTLQPVLCEWDSPTPTSTPTPTPTPTPIPGGLLLTVTKTGTGNGIIKTAAGELKCKVNICSAQFAPNSKVVVSAWENTPSSTFSGWTGCDEGSIGNQCRVTMTAPRSISVAFSGGCRKATKDFNGDGKSDILWQNSSTGDVAVWLMDGTAKTSTAFAAKAVPNNWKIRASADFNNDGKSDVLWQDTTTGDVLVWLMNGTSPQSAEYVYRGLSSEWQIQATGDFDGDCNSDILWQNSKTGDVIVWLMAGDKIKETGVITSAMSADWQVKGVGDLNGDGKADILWRNSKTGDIYGWIMDGKSIVAGSSGYIIKGVPPQYQVQSVADYDGDGKGDIQLYDVNTGKIYIWLMDGITITGWDSVRAALAIRAKSKAGSSLSGPMTEHGSSVDTWTMTTTGDYNGDGMNDMLWQNSNGDVYMWFMDGTTINSGGYVDQGIPSQWSIY